MLSLANKTGLIMGVANNKSLATGIAESLSAAGARLAFSYLPDETGKMKQRVEKAVGHLAPCYLGSCNVNDEQSLASFFSGLKGEVGQVDFLIHAVAFAPLEDIRCDTVDCTRKGFLQAMETSVFSFIAASSLVKELMPNGGSILTLTYYGGEKVVPGYNLMGVCKAALESAVKYLAYDLGQRNIRVNAISAGIVKTLAASAIGDFSKMLSMDAGVNPLGRNTTQGNVGEAAAFLVSDLAGAITGEVLHVDNGYHVMGSPGRYAPAT